MPISTKKGQTNRQLWAPLFRIAQMEMVRYLISAGADVNARAIYGCTALHIAHDKGDVEIGRLLLQQGADPTLECHGHHVPKEFLKLLQQHQTQ